MTAHYALSNHTTSIAIDGSVTCSLSAVSASVVTAVLAEINTTFTSAMVPYSLTLNVSRISHKSINQSITESVL